MKKYLFILAALFLIVVNTAYSQFSAGYTNVGNVITFKLRPSVTTTTSFSTIEFFVRYPVNSPAFTYGPPVVNALDFPGMTGTAAAGSGSWEIDRDNALFLLPGYHVDHIFYTAPAPVTTSNTYNQNQVYSLVSFAVIGDPTATINFELVHQNPEDKVYLAVTNENGVDLRAAALTNYFFPSTLQVAGPGNSTIYYSALAVPLPVKFVGFNVTKKNTDAILTWQIENESSIADRYEVERSINGVDFRKVYTVLPKANGKSNNSYELADLNLTAIRSSGIFYYRIKQVDKDDRFVYTGIKSLRLTSKGIVIAVFPNPVKDLAKVTIDLEQDANATVTINDASGKQMQTIQMQLFKGPNIKEINMGTFASGSYMLKVQTANEIKTIPVVKTN